MHSYTQSVIKTYKKYANQERSEQQKAYMKGKFEFFGLTSPERKEINRGFLLKTNLPEKQEAFDIIRELWEQPQRELQYFAMALAQKYLKQYNKDDIILYEHLITQKSWWDTVDYIAATLVGSYFKHFEHRRESLVNQWLISENMWLQRTCVLFQLKYKNQTDTMLLKNTINRLLARKEFFINKAIGWSLREYSKTDPDWVREIVQEFDDDLSNLSRREALKVIEKKKK